MLPASPRLELRTRCDPSSRSLSEREYSGMEPWPTHGQNKMLLKGRAAKSAQRRQPTPLVRAAPVAAAHHARQLPALWPQLQR